MSSDVSNMVLVIGSLALIVAGVVTAVFFLLSLQRALSLCAPQNRRIEPGKVWLCFIPLFGMIWIFVLVNRIADSLGLEFESRQAPAEDYGRSIGLAYCILAVISIIPLLNLLTGPAGFVCWIIYWVKISGFSRRLEQTGGSPEGIPAPEYLGAEGPFNLGQAWLVLLVLMFAYGGQQIQILGSSYFVMALRGLLGMAPQQLSWAFSAFTVGLMAGYVLLTVVTGLCGTRWGLVVALTGVSLVAPSWGAASSVGGMIAIHAILGFFAGGLLPAAIQSIREYFPAPLRPVAIGLFLATGPLVTLLMKPVQSHLAGAMGWRTIIMIAGLPTAAAAVLCWFLWKPPARSGGGVSGLGVVSVVMLGVGLLLATPLSTFVQSWLPGIIRRNPNVSLATLSAITWTASLGGAILAGAVAWGMMRAGVRAWKTRAVLVTIVGLIMIVAASLGMGAEGGLLLGVAALTTAAFQALSTVLYAAVADLLPARGVAIGAAIGALLSASVRMGFPLVLGPFMNEFGYRSAFGVFGAAAAAGVLCVSLLAWLVRPKTELPSAPLPTAA